MEKSIYLILPNIRSLYNIGSIFRTADAFGVEKIYLCGTSAYPLGDPKQSRGAHRQLAKIAKTALGAEKSVPWEFHRQTARLLKNLKASGVRIIALENNLKNRSITPLNQYQPKFPTALVLGNEVSGISRGALNIADDVVSIPMAGCKESLNVAVAASIALYGLINSKVK